MLRKIAEVPGKCPGCNGAGSTIKLRGDDPHAPIDIRCVSCQGTGYQTERQIVINKGANALILGSMH
jgi:DnaJ-class molecular chaperone